MSQFEYKPSYRRNLPHIQLPGATFFVTFHLADSLSRTILQQRRIEENQLTTDKHITSAQKRQHHEWQRQWFRKFKKMLDNAESGPIWLKDDRIAKMVVESLLYRDGKVYCLDAYCVMANHVHVVFTPLAIQPPQPNTANAQDDKTQTNSLRYNTLSSIMQSLKGYTARKANQILGRRGAFWHHESYDHAIRHSNEWQRIITYVLNNPVKADLVDEWKKWKWSYCRLEV
ncbi:MAG: hypothetical protein OXU36_20380 [Candidatus Poribacteria bacterium]|nr:hypothetical protein [Candidatus Poribacteria bacterium]